MSVKRLSNSSVCERERAVDHHVFLHFSSQNYLVSFPGQSQTSQPNFFHSCKIKWPGNEANGCSHSWTGVLLASFLGFCAFVILYCKRWMPKGLWTRLTSMPYSKSHAWYLHVHWKQSLHAEKECTSPLPSQRLPKNADSRCTLPMTDSLQSTSLLCVCTNCIPASSKLSQLSTLSPLSFQEFGGALLSSWGAETVLAFWIWPLCEDIHRWLICELCANVVRVLLQDFRTEPSLSPLSSFSAPVLAASDVVGRWRAPCSVKHFSNCDKIYQSGDICVHKCNIVQSQYTMFATNILFWTPIFFCLVPFACLSFGEFRTASNKHTKGLGARLIYACTNGCLALLSELGVYILTTLSGVTLR